MNKGAADPAFQKIKENNFNFGFNFEEENEIEDNDNYQNENEINKDYENKLNKKIWKPRPYQQQIYEKALTQNSIIFVETGKGKTFISIMLMANH